MGVEDDGQATGAFLSLDEVNTLQSMTKNSWKSPVPYHCEIIRYNNMEIVAFEVDPQADAYSLTDGRTP